MRIAVRRGTTCFRRIADGEPPQAGEVIYDGPKLPSDETGRVLAVWDSALDNIRAVNAAELLVAAKARRKRDLERHASSLVAALVPQDKQLLSLMRSVMIVRKESRGRAAPADIAALNDYETQAAQIAALKATQAQKEAEIDALSTEAAVRAYDITAGF